MEREYVVPNQDTNLGTTWNIGIPTFLIILKKRQVIKKKHLGTSRFLLRSRFLEEEPKGELHTPGSHRFMQCLNESNKKLNIDNK